MDTDKKTLRGGEREQMISVLYRGHFVFVPLRAIVVVVMDVVFNELAELCKCYTTLVVDLVFAMTEK